MLTRLLRPSQASLCTLLESGCSSLPLQSGHRCQPYHYPNTPQAAAARGDNSASSDARDGPSTSAPDESSGSGSPYPSLSPDFYEAEPFPDIPQDLSHRHSGSKNRQRKPRGPDRPLTHHHIPVPPEVDVTVAGTRFYFSGPLGTNALDLQTVDKYGLAAWRVVRGDAAAAATAAAAAESPSTSGSDRISAIELAGPDRAVLGTARTLINNKITGVSQGYLMYMQLVGVGYRVAKAPREVDVLVHKARGR